MEQDEVGELEPEPDEEEFDLLPTTTNRDIDNDDTPDDDARDDNNDGQIVERDEDLREGGIANDEDRENDGNNVLATTVTPEEERELENIGNRDQGSEEIITLASIETNNEAETAEATAHEEMDKAETPAENPTANEEGNEPRRSKRSRIRINYKELRSKGARQLAQKVKKIKGQVKKRFRVKVKDMFRRVMAITMAHISSVVKHDQVSVETTFRKQSN